MVFWIIGGVVLAFLCGDVGLSYSPVMIVPMAGFLQALLPFIPSILGVIGSIAKGKKTKFANQQTPQQQMAYNQLLTMLLARNKQGADPYGTKQMFYGQQQPQQPFVGGDATSPYAIRNRQGNPGA